MAIVRLVAGLIHKALPMVMAGGIAAGTFGYYTGNTHGALIYGGVGVASGVVHEIGTVLANRPKLTKLQKLQAKQAKLVSKQAKLVKPKLTPEEKLQQKIAATEAKAAKVIEQKPPTQ